MQIHVTSRPGNAPRSNEVFTPLDLIVRLERLERFESANVLLAGTFATDDAFRAFLAESYPALCVEREV